MKNACKRAEIKIWYPLQLRHNAATRLEQKLGTQSAQLLLGHSKPSTTEIYIARRLERALDNLVKIL